MINLDKQTELIKQEFFGTADLCIKEVRTKERKVVLIYLDAMVNLDQMELGVIAPLLKGNGEFEPTLKGLSTIITTGVTIEEMEELPEIVSNICSGECAMLMDKAESVFIIKLRSYMLRMPSEPPTSAVIKGPREGFTEDVKTNMVLMRRRFRTNKLIFETHTVGRYTDTTVVICYLKGIADEKLVRLLAKKIDDIDIDGIVDSSYIAKFLEERNYSIFKQTGMAEKPDIIAGKILEGRVAIIVDGSPIVLTLPFMLLEDIQDSQDYFKRLTRATLVRVMRLLAVFFAVVLPGAFVALQMHQFQMLPLKLLITVINSIEGIPFTPIVEMLIALLLFEILGEASIRMPRYVGMAISIVGAIILGETAVSAGILSAVTVLITALSGIGLYAIPDEVGAFSVIRILFVIVAGAGGMFGLVLTGLCILAYMVTMEIYGVPYLAPFAPTIHADLKDSLLKLDITAMKTRPLSLSPKNKTRLKNG